MSDEITIEPVNVNNRLTITMTDRVPVNIVKNEWPIVAESSEHYDNIEGYSKWRLIVRRHSTGTRAIVYATYIHRDNNGDRDYSQRGGFLLGMIEAEIAELPKHIRRMADWMALQEHHPGEEKRWSTLASTCMSVLPAEELA